jgi:hypothetical protein
MPPDEQDVQIRAQRAAFIKAFQDISVATANLAAISKKQIELMNAMIDTATGLAATVMEPKDGLRDVIDELIEEINGLRGDIRLIAKAGGMNGVLAALFSGVRGRKGG